MALSQIQYFRDEERKTYCDKAIRKDIAVWQDKTVIQNGSQVCEIKARCESNYQTDIGPYGKHDLFFVLRYVSEQDTDDEDRDPVCKSVEIGTHYLQQEQ